MDFDVTNQLRRGVVVVLCKFLEPVPKRIFETDTGLMSSDDDWSAVTPYWSSIPYPIQMMDRHYLPRKRARPAPIDCVTTSPLGLYPRQVRRYEELAPSRRIPA